MQVPDIRQLQRFVAVAIEGNFRRAAARLHISQPPLSDSIRHLEEEIGVPLLLRTTRPVELTKAGELFLERAQLILAQLEESVTMTRAVAKGLSGQITIGFFPTATYDVLPRILRRYRKKYPDVGLRFAELTTPEQPAALQEKRIDVGLFLAPTIDREGIAQETFLKEPLYVALPDDHRLAQQTEITLWELRNEPFIFIPPRLGTGYHARISYACQVAGFTPNVIEEVEHLHTMVSLVGAGIGITIGAASLRRFQPPGVVFREIKDPSSLLYIEFGFAWRQDDQSSIVSGFLDIARMIAPSMR